MKVVFLYFLCVIIEQNYGATFFGNPVKGKDGHAYIDTGFEKMSADTSYSAIFKYSNGCLMKVESNGPNDFYSGYRICPPKTPPPQPKKTPKAKKTAKNSPPSSKPHEVKKAVQTPHPSPAPGLKLKTTKPAKLNKKQKALTTQTNGKAI